jgi:hypothetical protein
MTRLSRTSRDQAKRMITSVKIKNFKCFKEASLNDLGMLNVVVGENGSGKTALLEGIFLSQGGSPELATRFRKWRGIGGDIVFDGTRKSYESLWVDLFFRFDQRKIITVEVAGDQQQARSLKIFYAPGEPSVIPTDQSDGRRQIVVSGRPSDTAAIVPITFEFTVDSGARVIPFRPLFTPTGLVMGSEPTPPSPCAFFSAHFPVITHPKEVADQFSRGLNTPKKRKDFISEIRKLYPQIRTLRVESEYESPFLACEISGIPEAMKLGQVSSGMHKIVSILVGMAFFPKGVIFIDEIENGLYYKTMPDVWRALLAFCKRFDIQIFASTHSKECLHAMIPSLAKDRKIARLIRVESSKTGSIAKTFSGNEFESALEMDVDFR